MGDAPKILEGLSRSRKRLSEKKDLYLDASTGELKPEIDPDEELQVKQQPVRVARQTFD